jgi:hypothetical protein
MGHLGAITVCIYCCYSPSRTFVRDLQLTPPCLGLDSLSYLVPTFGAHHVLSSRMTPIMPPWWTSNRLHPDECLPQASDQNHPPLHHSPTQIIPTITEGPDHLAFSDILEVQLHQPTNNMSTTAQAPVKMAKAPAQLKPMEVTVTPQNFKFWNVTKIH